MVIGSAPCKLLQEKTAAGICAYADQAAERASDKAVEKTFAILGVDVHDPEKVEKFRKGLRFSDSLMTAAEGGKMAFIVAVIGLAASAIFTIITAGKTISGGNP